MRHILKIEFIGQDKYAFSKKHPKEFLAKLATMPIYQLTRMLPNLKKKPWVAEIKNIDPQFKFQREFLNGQIDYTEANSIGSRGVYLYFILQENKIYEVFAHRSWKKSERYFIRFDSSGEEERLTESEVMECLRQRQSLNSKFQ